MQRHHRAAAESGTGTIKVVLQLALICVGHADRIQFYRWRKKIPVDDSAAQFSSLTVGDTPAAAKGGVKIQKDLLANTVTSQSSVTSPAGTFQASSVTAGSITSTGGIHADSSISSSGDITGGNITARGNMMVHGYVTAKQGMCSRNVAINVETQKLVGECMNDGIQMGSNTPSSQCCNN